MTRPLALAAIAGITTVLMGGCTSSDHSTASAGPSATMPSSTSTAPANLPNPLPSDLPLGSKILVQRTGSGSATLDLTRLIGTATSVTIRWTCLGPAGLQITDGTSKTIVGSGCATNLAGVTFDGGDIPLNLVSSRDWKLETISATTWRIVIIADS
jgi:hypothetical protein